MRDALLRLQQKGMHDECMDKSWLMQVVSASTRLAKAASLRTPRAGRFGKVWLLLGFALSATPAAWAATPTPPGTIINNEAVLTWQGPVGSTGLNEAPRFSLTTTQVTPVTGTRTQSSAFFLTYAQGSAAALIGPTQCSRDGGATFNTLPAPISAQGSTLDPNSAQPLGPAQMYFPGDPVFVQITDHDQNLNPLVRETILASVSVTGTSQTVTVRLTENGPDSGTFTGYVPSSSDSASNTCALSLQPGQRLALQYTDIVDSSDTSAAQALVSPYNVVFDSTTGARINGAKITLVDADTGVAVAHVTGRDGVSSFPSSVTSGQSVTDSSGASYSAATGAYLLPQVVAGHYRLQVVPPAGYRYASTATPAALQQLTGAPYTLGPASLGQTFTVTGTQPIGFDIPLDPISSSLFVQKTASVNVAAVGDMIQFSVAVENSDKLGVAQNVRLVDTLPQGFRYVQGSARVGTAKAADPQIAANGQQLEFDLGNIDKSGQRQLTYVTEVTAATPLGASINRAQGVADGGTASNIATAQVEIRNELMQDVNTVIGRVLVGCDPHDGRAAEGLAGVRVLMENGSYVVSDKDGRFHFQAVKNGTHVVQLDTASLPPGYAAENCERNTRFAGRSYSQFVELHGGALWRADFHVRRLPPPSGRVAVQLSQQADGTLIRNTLALSVEQVPVSKLSSTIMLPEGARYVPGSASLDGTKVAEPGEMAGALVFRLGDRGAGWHGKLQFDLQTKAQSAMQTTKALANFDTPSASHQHTPAASAVLAAAGQARSPVQHLATAGIAPADQAKVASSPAAIAADARSLADTYQLDMHSLAGAGSEAAFVWPTTDYLPAVPSIKVAVKHGPGQQVQLSVDGALVPAANFLGAKGNPGHTLAVSQWLGVPLHEGDNTLLAKISEGGKVVQRVERKVHYSGAPTRAELVLDKSTLVADGKSRPQLAIRLFDRWGYPVRRGMTGRYTLQSPYQPYQSQQDLQDHQLLAIAPREPKYTVGNDGIALLELAPTTVSGQIALSIPLQNDTHQDLRAWMQPGKRDWILVGVANGTAAFNDIRGHIENVSGTDPNRDLFQDGRVALYAKGMIKGKYLLTAAYDSAKASGANRATLNGLQQSVDPNQYFMLYGDAAEQGYDASSASKLYLKIERGQFYAMFGDFDTHLNVTELSRYDRRFNGVQSAYEGKHVGYTAFAARNAQSYVRDEIQGNGTSGLYHLARTQILLNSERIRLETRDRYHNERVINTQQLSSYLDYTLDYYSGALFFKQPVPSFDENMNPVYIVAEYEVMRPGDQSITAGGRVAVKTAGDRLELGVTMVNEGADTGSNRLGGADLRVKLAANTELKAEVAHTSSAAGTSSLLTGYSNVPGAATSNTNQGSGTAYLVTVQNHGKRLESELYARQLGVGFGLGQQSLGQGGTRKVGGNARYLLNKNWALQMEAYREQSLQLASTRTVADAGVRYQANNRSLTMGLRHVSDDYPLAVATVAGAGNGGITSGILGNGLGSLASGSADQVYLGGSTGIFNNKVTLHGITSQNINGNDPAYPASTLLGVDYKVTDAATLFVNQQFNDGVQQQYSRMTELGVRATPWQRAQLTNSVGQQMTEYGPRTFATSGLTQGWQVSKSLTLSAGLNQVKSLHRPDAATTGTTTVDGQGVPVAGSLNAATPSIAASATQDFTSMFVGSTWRQKDWSWTSRVESLRSTSEKRLGVMGGFYRDLSAGNAFSSSLQAFDSRFNPGGKSSNVTVRFSFAHRPDDGRWSLLEQLDLTWNNQQGLSVSPFLQQGSTGVAASQQSPQQLASSLGSSGTFGINQQAAKLVNNLQANYRGDHSQWSLYYGSKYARYKFDSGSYAGYTDLIGSEFRYDVSEHWDVGVIASRMHSYRSGVSSSSLGLETGWDVGTNMWLSVGYNFKGYYDQDFTAAHYTAKGMFLRFRFKFDQDTVKALAEGLGR
ncbi:hypothetical protein [Rhodanobacter ginsengiterrae]|uniref:hypothetical protein n=1 Tax=Rhodanobacter ginsengiterrae TaxID=2008451 RepID=UPI003CF6F53B